MKYFRRVIEMPATMSPNVRLALKELGLRPEELPDQEAARAKVEEAIAKRGHPSGEVLVPGVMSWDVFLARLLTFDAVKACVGLFARFWDGADAKMYPKDWLLHSAAKNLPRGLRRAKGIGVDSAEGGDNTSLAAVDELGLLALESHKTPNTAVVPDLVRDFASRWLPHPVRWERVMFDRGGGGKQHADNLRARGYKEVRTTSFGETITLEPKLGMTLLQEKREVREDRIYKNRRAEMAHELRMLMDPANATGGWAIPEEFLLRYRGPKGEDRSLMRQMSPIPLTYTQEGSIYLIPKTKGEKAEREEDWDGPTIVKLVGFSPDEWDAVMLACRAMLHRPSVGRAGAA